jgi:hypothetical protein
VPFKDGAVADIKQHHADQNRCIQEAMPLYPTRWIQQPYWEQVPVYASRVVDGKSVLFVSHYRSRLSFETIDANESDRDAYIDRCLSAKGYTYRYLSKEELQAVGLE